MRRAFTLVELLVVIGIVALLIALLLPGLKGAREQARSAQCLSNLRQMTQACHAYIVEHRGRFPLSYWGSDSWDFSRDGTRVVPGLLWRGRAEARIQQCPSFEGASNSPGDPFTGYNYNASFIGAGQYETRRIPATLTQVRSPSRTALFGDGEWSGGANKHMRSPFPSPSDLSTDLRVAGTQGFRHRGGTNVGFVDGHAETLFERHTETLPPLHSRIAPRCGFLSADNSLYDLE